MNPRVHRCTPAPGEASIPAYRNPKDTNVHQNKKDMMKPPKTRQQQPAAQGQQKSGMAINAFVLLFFIMVVCAVLTYIMPAGKYDRIEKNGRTLVVPDSFHFIDASPVGFFDIFKSVHSGMVNGAGIMFFVLIIGGAFGILKVTGTLDALIHTLTKKLADRELLLIPVIMLFFSIGGTLMGMAEETIVYIAIITPLTIALKLDAIVGLAIVLLSSNIGFMSAVLNPFNIGVAQSIAELPAFSGIKLRIILLSTLYVVGVLYVLRYARKIKSSPELRYIGNLSENVIAKSQVAIQLTTRHKWILGVFLSNFVVLVFGVIRYGWYIPEIAALFLLFGIIIGIIGKLTPNTIANSFIEGAKELTAGALLIGLTQAILVIIRDGAIIDSILYYAVLLIGDLPPTLNAIGMFIVQLLLNFFVPSGSGQAALTMPIMAPLSDLVGVTRQTAVLAFQLGDGISNMIFPTSGILLAGLAVSGIPLVKWVKWVMPFILIEITIAIIFLIIAQVIHYGPF